jgi:ring-1,2-phenylacetyl-CoA epoxidase subunit PaaE
VFFFAAGIGITPIFSLLKTALYSYPGLQIVLIYSNRNREEVVFYDELVQLQNEFTGRLKIEFLFSSAFDLSRARLSKWLLPTLINEYAIIPRQEILYYLCGPFTYMRMVVIGLEEQGVPDENIRKENFATVTNLPQILPPDTVAHQVRLLMQGNEYHFEVQYPETILRQAKKQGIPIPYSCEAGQCGSCVALCRQGSVWMSYNEVLTDADIAAGKVLTCTGYPVHGDVLLEI